MKIKRREFIFLHVLLWLLFSYGKTSSQVYYEDLNHQLRGFNQMILSAGEIDSAKSSAFKPALLSDVTGTYKSPYRTYAPSNSWDSSVFSNRKYKEYSWFRRKLLYENFFIIDTGKLYITIDPLFDVSAGGEEVQVVEQDKSSYKNRVFNNTRGLLIRADFGRKLSMETYFYENQSEFPVYIDTFVQQNGVIPGQGRPKDFKENGFDYAYSGGYFSYRPNSYFNIQFGHHKHFIGDGYRSLVLSDNSFNYPFLRMNFWLLKNKVSYSVMYASFQDLERLNTSAASEEIFRRKGGSFHVLEYRISNFFRISLMQAMMWRTMDNAGKSDVNYNMFNPLILVNPISVGMNDVNNALIALGMKLNPWKRLEIYGQFAVDDDKFEDIAVQLGGRVKVAKNLILQAEGNQWNNNMYNPNTTDFNNGFNHYNQNLAYSSSIRQMEYILRIFYRYKRIIPDFQLNLFPSNRPDLSWMKIEVAYLLNPATNLKIFTNYIQRTESEGSVIPETTLWNFGIKTDLRNIYYDF